MHHPSPPTLPLVSRGIYPRWVCRRSPGCLQSAHLCAVNMCRIIRCAWRVCSQRKVWMIIRKSHLTRRIYGVNFTKGGLRWLLQNQEGTYRASSFKRMSTFLHQPLFLVRGGQPDTTDGLSPTLQFFFNNYFILSKERHIWRAINQHNI